MGIATEVKQTVVVNEHILKKIAIVYSYGLTFYKNSDLAQTVANGIKPAEFVNDRNILRSYYLEADEKNADPDKLRYAAKMVWQRILEWNPDKIVFWHEPAFDIIVQKYAQYDERPQAYFCLYPHERMLEGFERKDNYYMTLVDPSIASFLDYLSDNGVDFDNYYIIRDISTTALAITDQIKEELGVRKNVQQFIVSDIHQLRKVLLELKLEPQGVIIPLVTRLKALDTLEYFNASAINRIIANSNFHHLELMYMDENMHNDGAIHYTVLHSLSKSPLRNKGDTAFHNFVFHENGEKKIEYIKKHILIDLNRLKELGLDSLTRDFSDVYDIRE